ncbi:hypothetical protein ABT167_36555 [Streptomyces sp. NPDC001792]|uniref:hypothetical protein n=1 Tax=Streptomyces sp. NPDC001792 TaxID=3154524 RepID=UPI003332CF3D
MGPNGEPLDAPAVRRHRERMCQGYDHALSAFAERLNGLGRVTVAGEFRLYPGIPRDKICIINAQRVLVAVARFHVLPGGLQVPFSWPVLAGGRQVCRPDLRPAAPCRWAGTLLGRERGEVTQRA